MEKILLNATKRDERGRKAKALRKKGILPANLYGKNIKSEAVSIDFNEFTKIYKKAGETSIVELLIGKEKKPTLIHNVQLDPVEDKIIHADFLQVDLKTKVAAHVRIELTGECSAEKMGEGTVVQYLHELEIEALPTDLPESFVVDISKLEKVDDQFAISDIKFDKSKIEFKEETDKVIVRVEPLRKEEVVQAPKEEEGVVPEAEEGEKKEEAEETKEEAAQESSKEE